MTEARPRRGKPSPRAVFWGSAALFATLFVLLALQLSRAGASGDAVTSRPVEVQKVIVRRVVTTVVPAPGEATPAGEAAPPASTSTLVSAPAPEATETVEPVTTGAS